MSKNREDLQLYCDEGSYSRIRQAGGGAFVLWLVTLIGSLWVYDWAISWGQILSYSSGCMIGYWLCIQWIKSNTGRLDLD